MKTPCIALVTVVLVISTLSSAWAQDTPAPKKRTATDARIGGALVGGMFSTGGFGGARFEWELRDATTFVGGGLGPEASPGFAVGAIAHPEMLSLGPVYPMVGLSVGRFGWMTTTTSSPSGFETTVTSHFGYQLVGGFGVRWKSLTFDAMAGWGWSFPWTDTNEAGFVADLALGMLFDI